MFTLSSDYSFIAVKTRTFNITLWINKEKAEQHKKLQKFSTGYGISKELDEGTNHWMGLENIKHLLAVQQTRFDVSFSVFRHNYVN